MSVPHYDLAVIGSGPAGQKGAIAAAKLRKKVVVIDRRDMVGGCSLHLGTIPSKTMREAILYLTGIRQRTFYGADYRAKEDISPRDLSQRVDIVLQREIDVVKSQLKRNGVSAINGMARFADANTIEIEGSDGSTSKITADTILIACGTRPAENPLIVTDAERVFNSDQLLHLPLIHLLAVGVSFVRYGSAHWFFESPSLDRYPFTLPPAWGYSLPVVYGFWILVLVLMYPLCSWFANVKARHRAVWLRYL